MSLKGNILRRIIPKTYAVTVRNIQAYDVMKETFIEDQYRWLVTGIKPNTVVLDIGANVGDSTVYLARCQNVKKVYAYEPYPILFQEAKRNCALSRLSDKIILRNAGISNFDGNLHIPKFEPANAGSKLKIFKSGMRVKIYSINTVLNYIRGLTTHEIIIKSDCEGEEYKIFGQNIDLRNVKRMQIEYHSGPKDIPKILRSNGFTVKVKKPRIGNLSSGGIGWIYAESTKSK